MIIIIVNVDSIGKQQLVHTREVDKSSQMMQLRD